MAATSSLLGHKLSCVATRSLTRYHPAGMENELAFVATTAQLDFGSRRILALDGGGLRAFFTLEVLVRLEELVRQRLGRPDAVLADHFHLIAGTSTGAIVGAFLAWGLPVARIRELYLETAGRMFHRYRNPLRWVWRARYNEDVLTGFLRRFFVEEDGREAALGSTRLRTLYLAVMRNVSTGSAWPLCSHPALKYNAASRPDSNLLIPLWQIVRASTAAPTFFAPERIAFGGRDFRFVDGGITPYNNPALIAALMATEPAYRIRWPRGENRLHVLSVGTGHTRTKYTNLGTGFWNWQGSVPVVVTKTITALIEGASQQQDFLCRVLGRCLYGPEIDREVGDLIEHALEASEAKAPDEPRRFSYVRYNTDFPEMDFAAVLARHGGAVPMDLPALIPQFTALGKAYAAEHVRDEHLR